VDARSAVWDRTGHRLFLVEGAGVRSWTPEAGFAPLPGSKQWSFLPGLSPNGGEVAYTAYADSQQTQLRSYAYNFASGATRSLSEVSRSQVVFVKAGWVWYLDEAPCADCGPWGTGPSGKVFALELASGRESEVSFAAGEAPVVGHDWRGFSPGEFWPAG
jgi:hypothetical protein